MPSPPPVVVELAEGAPLTLVWTNDLGGTTYTWVRNGVRRYVKWNPARPRLDLAGEVERLRWAAPYVPVPDVLAYGADDDAEWLVTLALPGGNAVEDRWVADPAPAVTAIGVGLRALHDRLPVADCPFSWTVDSRLEAIRRRVDAGEVAPTDWHPVHAGMSVTEALSRLEGAPPVDHLVVCHGDPCAPNTLLDDDGRWTGNVDLDQLGVGDRWADLAVALWSLEWNYGPGWDAVLLEAYGVEPDEDRCAYYRLLWDLG